MTQASIYCGSATEYYFDERCYITEWWNSTDDADVSVARARVEPGVTTRLHRLSNTTERYLILDGQGRVEIEGLAPSVVGPGDVVVIPSGVSQRISNTGGNDLVFLAVCTPRFTPDAYEDIDTDGMDEVQLR
ncbi:cupin domain-containing protein [Methylococcus sp. ANG]|uniref:cupin domain-containing protein n=1 Tax=unclassified Methylococcus TaxID=2618889 RepID=UPI001C528D9C|nr:cupin domain-containing protein [Methylococcus sp. Mc7]QXP84630.1 cupin domain-containing protein [Methylococcus sp. Mc7]